MKVQYFSNATDLKNFVNTGANAVTQVIAITYDAGSGKFVLFYQ